MLEENLMYLRKSRQDNENEPIEEVLARHERQLQEYAVKLLGHTIDEKNIYREVVSGETIEDRPEINKMFERLQNEDIKRVLVVEPSRLTRGDLLDCGTVVHLFRYTNTTVCTPMKEYNLSDKYDRKFFEMELTRGNDYLEYTKEILERGRNASIHEGNYLGSIAPYGYDKVKIDKSCTLAINDKEAEFVRLMFKMYAIDGIGTQEIANTLTRLGAKPRKAEYFNKSVVKQMIMNPVYIGKIKYKFKPTKKVYENGKLVKKRTRNYDCELIDGKHPAIISEELFNKAKARNGNVSKEKTTKELRNPFAGLLKCKKCGKAIGMRPRYDRGYRSEDDRYFCTSGIYCDTKSCKASIVQEAILNSLKSFLRDFEIKLKQNNDDDIKTHENIIKSLTKDLEQIEKKQDELYDLLEDGIYTKEIFLIRNEKLADERDRLKKSLEKAKSTIPTISDYEKKVFSLHKAIKLLSNENVSAKEKNNFLKEIIEVIYYEKNKATPNKGNDIDNINLEIVLR